MKTTRKIMTSAFLGLLSLGAQAKADCTTDCQLSKVNQYFDALDTVSYKGSTAADIDALINLMHDEVKYEHIEYQANFDKPAWRRAFLRNLESGRYDSATSREIRVLRTIPGKSHIAVEYAYGVNQADGSWQQQEPMLAVFGFKDGKISLIRELW
ncbi:nuclear transport factor 2 family protein [Pseudoalteromonas rubra]|nr:nuclear transport factor 2 family protein [Pseudoalteromonas rubra]